MKHRGSILEFTEHRNRELLTLYRRLCAQADYIVLSDIVRQVVDSPAPRFWVSEKRALIVCSEIMRGRPVLQSMRPLKREMFSEIYSRFSHLSALHPDRPAIDIITEVVNSPAPKFYMEPSSARIYLFKIRKSRQ